MGQWLWKPWRKHAKALDPWGFSPPPQRDQLLHRVRIMANKRVGTLEMRLRLQSGEVEPKHLGVTLPDFTEWALPYILIRDEDTKWAGWHDIEGLDRVCHAQDWADHEQRPVQFLLTKPLRNAQTYPNPPRSATYRTVSLPMWHDAYRHVDTVGFLGDDFCTPLGVYVASLPHGVRDCSGGGGVCATCRSPWTCPALWLEPIAGSCEAVCPWYGRTGREAYIINWNSVRTAKIMT